MTVLAAPALEGPEPQVPGMRFPNGSCLQLAIASVAGDVRGAAVTPQLVDSYFAPAPGHTIEEGSAVLVGRLGVPCAYQDGTVPLRTYAPAALAAGHEVIVEYQCDGFCRPVPLGASNIRHFVVCYGCDAANYYVMQSWTRALLAIPRAQLEAADTRQHIEITTVMPKDRGGAVMWTLGAKRAFARLLYATFVGRDPDSQAAEDSWAASIADDGSNLDAVALTFRQTPESQNWMARVRAAVLAPAAGGLPADAQVATEVGRIKAALGIAGSSLTGASE